MAVLDILLPLYMIISLGYFFKRRQFPAPNFWEGVDKLVYHILFPALIFATLSRADINSDLIWSILLLITLPTFLIGASQWLGFAIPGISRETFTSMYQGAVRNNTTIGLVVAGMVLPGQGVAIMALIMTIMVVINNISCVIVLSHYGNAAGRDPSRQNQSMVRKLISNPLIIACLTGFVFNLLEIKLPNPLHQAIYFLGQTGLPLALLTVGAGLNLTSLNGKTFAIIYSTFSKVIATPLIIYALVIFVNLNVASAQMFVLYGALPTAMSSYVLASQLGGDKETMAQIITLQTLVVALTLPIALIAIRNMV